MIDPSDEKGNVVPHAGALLVRKGSSSQGMPLRDSSFQEERNDQHDPRQNGDCSGNDARDLRKECFSPVLIGICIFHEALLLFCVAVSIAAGVAARSHNKAILDETEQKRHDKKCENVDGFSAKTAKYAWCDTG